MNTISKIITFCAMFVTASISYAVDLQYDSGQQSITTSISGTDYSGPISNEDSEIFTTSFSDIGIEIVNNYSSSNANTYMSLNSFPDCDKQLADLHASCSVSSISYESGTDIDVLSQFTTANEPDSLGYFVKIIPSEEGEKAGDKVSVTINLNPYVDIKGDNTYVWMRGPAGRDHFCIALNPEYDENGMPTEETEIYSHENILTNSSFSDSGSIEFEAKIGDVIGIFIEVGCSVHQTDTSFRYASVSSPVYFELELLKNSADINNDGYVNMLDVAILANNWLWTRSTEPDIN